MLEGARCELTLLGTLEVDGTDYPVKCRLDLVSGLGILVDLKTTDALTTDEVVRRELTKLDYIGQAAFYFEMAVAAGLPVQAWGWLFVNLKTHDVFGIDVDDDDLAFGGEMWRKAFATYIGALRSGEWKGALPDDQFTRVRLPDRYKRDSEADVAEDDDDADELGFWGE